MISLNFPLLLSFQSLARKSNIARVFPRSQFSSLTSQFISNMSSLCLWSIIQDLIRLKSVTRRLTVPSRAPSKETLAFVKATRTFGVFAYRRQIQRGPPLISQPILTSQRPRTINQFVGPLERFRQPSNPPSSTNPVSRYLTPLSSESVYSEGCLTNAKISTILQVCRVRTLRNLRGVWYHG